jgi:hypothetical protein
MPIDPNPGLVISWYQGMAAVISRQRGPFLAHDARESAARPERRMGLGCGLRGIS